MAEQTKEETKATDADQQGGGKKKNKKVPGLKVTSKKDGFRRGGRDWNGTTEVRTDEFTKVQLAQLKSEPMLVVEEIEVEISE